MLEERTTEDGFTCDSEEELIELDEVGELAGIEEEAADEYLGDDPVAEEIEN